jgi:hypothetical protein
VEQQNSGPNEVAGVAAAIERQICPLESVPIWAAVTSSFFFFFGTWGITLISAMTLL